MNNNNNNSISQISQQFPIQKRRSRGFFSTTFTVPVSDSQEQVKELVLIESNENPSIFLVFFDNRFLHVSLRTHLVLSSGTLTTDCEPTQFKRISLENCATIYISYVAQFKLNFIDLTHQRMETNLFKISIPTHPSSPIFAGMRENERAILASDGFSYECFEAKSTIVTCEVAGVISSPIDASKEVICTVFHKDHTVPKFTFKSQAISRQITLCKLDNISTVGIYENHALTIEDPKNQNKIIELVLHVQNISIHSLEGHRVLRLPLREDTCVLSIRFIDVANSKVLVVGNEKNSPFFRVFQVLPYYKGEGASATNIHILTDLQLTEINSGMLRRVIFTEDDHMLVEKVCEQGTYLELLRTASRKKEFKGKIQLLKNPHQPDRETHYWMEDSDFQEMNFFYKDRMYVQTVSAASPKTLVYVDDSNFDKDLGMKPYSLIIHSVHITTHSTMLLHLMMKNELMNGYAEIHINNIIEMVLASAD